MRQYRLTVSRESEVREALYGFISTSSHHRDHDYEVINEFWVPVTNERVDVTVIGSIMEGFEIKTARDSLRRLPRQVDAYARIFDQCTAVIAECHMVDSLAVIPSWWGVILVNGAESPTLTPVRDPRRNPSIDAETLVRLLWRNEANSALVELGVELPPGSGRVAMWQELLRVVDLEDLSDIVRSAVLTRQTGKTRFRWRV